MLLMMVIMIMIKMMQDDDCKAIRNRMRKIYSTDRESERHLHVRLHLSDLLGLLAVCAAIMADHHHH